MLWKERQPREFVVIQRRGFHRRGSKRKEVRTGADCLSNLQSNHTESLDWTDRVSSHPICLSIYRHPNAHHFPTNRSLTKIPTISRIPIQWVFSITLGCSICSRWTVLYLCIPCPYYLLIHTFIFSPFRFNIVSIWPNGYCDIWQLWIPTIMVFKCVISDWLYW